MRIMILLFFLMLLPILVMAMAEIPIVPEKYTKNDFAIIAPNEFYYDLNYSYDKVDRHVLNAPASAEATIESLAAYLVEPAKNDREKARAIFRWITENIDYNVEVFFGGGSGSAKSEDVLKSRRSICYGYSDLFLSLAREAGLDAVRITGYGKGYGYVPGKNFSGPFNHAWNAVKINGSWYLIDCTWGAGFVNGEGEYVRKFDDHYFMTPPSQFIFSHFPEDFRWQLLNQPLTRGEYENLVYLEADFFNLGLMLGERNGTIIVDTQINLSIFAPQDVLIMAKLEHAGTGEALDGYTLCQRDGGRYDIDVRFPEEGSYILKAYAKSRYNPGKYDSVLAYSINASSGGGVVFPVNFKAFSETGAYLIGPLDGRLMAGSTYFFRIRVPGARNVSVVCGDDWTTLASRGDMFEGNATAIEGDVMVFGKFQGAEWDGLVRYTAE